MPFPGSQQLVDKAESSLGRRFPPELRTRFIQQNGGSVIAAGETWSLFPVWDPTDRKTAARTANHVIRENEALRREWPEALPPGFIAIADNDGGDYLVLGPTADDVLLWDHETRATRAVKVAWAPFVPRGRE
jgi:hypothetical protein